MAIEIERKFLVRDVTPEAPWRQGRRTHYRQGYLSGDRNPTVRVRSSGDGGWLAVKGPIANLVRHEFEYPIPAADADALLELCGTAIVEKYRFVVQHNSHTWEVDEFLGANDGLVIAEIELQSPDQTFDRPPWLGVEVTTDPRYANSRLALQPYSQWSKFDRG